MSVRFFLCVLGMCEKYSSVVYFRGCIVEMLYWTWIGGIMAVVC